MTTEECTHSLTRGREGETGSWCTICGVKVLEVHDKPCNECRHYGNTGQLMWPPYCTRKHMTITRTMHVCYFINRPSEDGGLCFEGKVTTCTT